jgi:hypothetical protein
MVGTNVALPATFNLSTNDLIGGYAVPWSGSQAQNVWIEGVCYGAADIAAEYYRSRTNYFRY